MALKEPITEKRQPVVTFIGKLDYLPNTEGIIWFVENVYRHLKKVSYKL